MDPPSFFDDPDPADFLNADPDPDPAAKKCGSGSTLPRTFQHEIKQKIKLVFRKTEPFGYTLNGTTRSSNTNKSYFKLPVSTVMGMPGVSTGPWLVLTSVCIA